MASNSPGSVEGSSLLVDLGLADQRRQEAVNTVANVVASSLATSIVSHNQMQRQMAPAVHALPASATMDSASARCVFGVHLINKVVVGG